MHPPSLLSCPRQVLGSLALIGALAILTWNLLPTTAKEPVYEGKTLSQLLFHREADFIWMPNDFYGHIHDELWSDLVSQPVVEDTRSPRAAPIFNPLSRIDTNTIPLLLQWMEARSTPWDRVRDIAGERLPLQLGFLVDPYMIGAWSSRAGRWRIAAQEGFGWLGTNAEPALPALSNLLHSAESARRRGMDDLPLTLATARIGPRGISLLTNFLTTTNTGLRDDVALALGFGHSPVALPALVACVQRGQAGYHVLGAIGRIGGKHPGLVPALIRLLELDPLPAGVEFREDMAMLVLGLQGSEARPAIPVLLARYRALAEDEPVSSRVFLRRVIRSISSEAEAQLPSPKEDETHADWP
jgi:hypothetical protein